MLIWLAFIFYTVRPRRANEPGAFVPNRKKEVISMAQSKAEYPTSDCLAPAAIEAKTEAAGVTKANLPVSKAFLLAMFAGAFIAFGGLFFTVFLSDPTLCWGAQRFVGGLAFCLGLVLVLICGAELFTGNSLMVCALKSKKITLVQMLKAWAIVWIGNFAGALFVVFLIYMAAIYKLNGEAVANTMVSVAAGKVTIGAVTIFFRGILCNIFVCLAVWIGTAGKTVVDKVVGILLPIAAFVACGFEHCVANMYFLPMGILMHSCGYGAECRRRRCPQCCRVGAQPYGRHAGQYRGWRPDRGAGLLVYLRQQGGLRTQAITDQRGTGLFGRFWTRRFDVLSRAAIIDLSLLRARRYFFAR